MRNIYLIGMIGSGKSTTGSKLAKLAKMKFVDLDEKIVAQEHKSINEIFQTNGESYFRKVESTMLFEVSQRSGLVVASGGGSVLDSNNRKQMKKSGTVIYLKTTLDELWSRVRNRKNRPLLATDDPLKTMGELLQVREPLYQSVADRTILTDGKSPEAVAKEILVDCMEKNEAN